jgi:hypothetical protein
MQTPYQIQIAGRFGIYNPMTYQKVNHDQVAVELEFIGLRNQSRYLLYRQQHELSHLAVTVRGTEIRG